MKIFVAMIADRHTDVEPHLFTTAEAAIEHARAEAHSLARNADDDIEEPVDGWLFYANYSPEGDCVWVVEKELDGSVPTHE